MGPAPPRPRGRYGKTKPIRAESCQAVSFYSRQINSTALVQADVCGHGYRSNNSLRANTANGWRQPFKRPNHRRSRERLFQPKFTGRGQQDARVHVHVPALAPPPV